LASFHISIIDIDENVKRDTKVKHVWT
jgi:hypothetical protein